MLRPLPGYPYITDRFGWTVQIEKGKKESDIFGWLELSRVINISNTYERPRLLTVAVPKNLVGSITLQVRVNETFCGALPGFDQEDWRNPFAEAFTLPAGTNGDPDQILKAIAYFVQYYDLRWLADSEQTETISIVMTAS